jgi:hypothetical protein
MKLIDKVLAFAAKCGSAANAAENVGHIDTSDVYSVGTVDTDGFPLPTGLPRFVLVDGETFSFVDGEDALDLMSILDK